MIVIDAAVAVLVIMVVMVLVAELLARWAER